MGDPPKPSDDSDPLMTKQHERDAGIYSMLLFKLRPIFLFFFAAKTKLS